MFMCTLQVNKCAGELKYTAVHYAALRNNESIMTLLLQYGADLEIRNIEHLPPLALTTSYSIRYYIYIQYYSVR